MKIIIQKTKEWSEPNWNYLFWVWDLEKEWKRSQQKFTDKELLTIFPEVKKVIPKKIEEYKEEFTKISGLIRKKLIHIKEKVPDEFSQWFWRYWTKINSGEKLIKIEGHITRLKRLLMISCGRYPRGWLTKEQIEQALKVPIESLMSQTLKNYSKALIGLCPFHPEKHPSFYIYLETNRYWCYGCNQGGNVINFVRLLYGYSFKEAVKYLTK